MFLGRFFSLIDIFGIRTEFQINNKSKFQTTSGGFFTLIFIGLLLFLLFVLGDDIVYHKNPTTGFSQRYTPIPAETNISRNGYFFMLGLQYSNSTHFIDPSIYNVTCHNGFRNITTGSYSKIPIPLEPCTTEHLPDDPQLKHYFETLVGGVDHLKDIYCIKKGHDHVFSIAGEWDQEIFKYFQVKIYTCENSSSSDQICKDNQTIESQLTNGYYGFYSTDNLFDMSNYEQPSKMFGRDYFIPTSLRVPKSIVRYIKTNRVQSDDSWLMSNVQEKEYFSFDSDKESFNILDNILPKQKFVDMQVRKQYYENIYSRTYKKIKTLAGEMTGFLNLFLLILTLISKPFIKREYYEAISNDIFNFEVDRATKNIELMKSGTVLLKSMMDSQTLQTQNVENKKKSARHFSQMMKLRDSPIRISWWESIKSLFWKAPEIETKVQQKNKGVTTIFSHLDINYVLKKFLEIDKLKNLLLNKDQVLLFDYLPKPIILKNLQINLDHAGISNSESEIKPAKLNKKLRIEDELILKAKNLKQAYGNICTKSEMTPIDIKLINMLDENMKNILKNDKDLDSPMSSASNIKRERFALESPGIISKSVDIPYDSTQKITLNKC